MQHLRGGRMNRWLDSALIPEYIIYPLIHILRADKLFARQQLAVTMARYILRQLKSWLTSFTLSDNVLLLV